MGFGKKNLGEEIAREGYEAVRYLLGMGERITVESSLFALPVLNVLWTMVGGKSYSRSDMEMKKLLDLNTLLFESQIFFIALHMPSVRFLLPSLTGYSKWLEGVNQINDIIKKEIKEHEATLDEDDPRDFIDMYLIEMKKNNDPDFSTKQLMMICHDLMSAGSETTATTLNWIIMYLSLYPEVQDRCYQEIEEGIGQGIPTPADMDKLDFCQATICEIQRVAQVAVSSVQHKIHKEVPDRRFNTR